jgi:hypothetical protein
VQLLAFPQIGVAVIVGVGSEDFSSKVPRSVPQALKILHSSVQHGWPMGMILTPAEASAWMMTWCRPSMRAWLLYPWMTPWDVFILADSLSVRLLLISLPVVPYLGSFSFEPLLEALSLLLQTLHLLLPVSSASRT